MYSPLPPSPLRVPMGLESWADSDFRMAFGVASALADTGDRGKGSRRGSFDCAKEFTMVRNFMYLEGTLSQEGLLQCYTRCVQVGLIAAGSSRVRKRHSTYPKP